MYVSAVTMKQLNFVTEIITQMMEAFEERSSSPKAFFLC
jgi:hypothetical protein